MLPCKTCVNKRKERNGLTSGRVRCAGFEYDVIGRDRMREAGVTGFPKLFLPADGPDGCYHYDRKGEK